MVETVEESMAGFRRFTAELLQIKETETDPLRAVEAVKDWARRFEADGVWPVLDHSKRDLCHKIHKTFKETDVWTQFCKAQVVIADWVSDLLGVQKINGWRLIRSEKEWTLYVMAAVAAKQYHYLLEFHKEAYEGAIPEKYPCLARIEQRSCDTWPSWWEADFVYEEDARALMGPVSGPEESGKVK